MTRKVGLTRFALRTVALAPLDQLGFLQLGRLGAEGESLDDGEGCVRSVGSQKQPSWRFWDEPGLRVNERACGAGVA